MKTDPIPLRPPGGGRKTADAFRLNWKGRQPDRWHIMSQHVDLPLRVATSAVSELLTRDQGRAFLLPSLSRACHSPLSLHQVDRDLDIIHFQEGADSGIFKVDARIKLDGGEPKTYSICLNVARGLERVGLRCVRFNDLNREGYFTGVIEDEALAEKYGEAAARSMVLSWLATYVFLDREADKIHPEKTKKGFSERSWLIRRSRLSCKPRAIRSAKWSSTHSAPERITTCWLESRTGPNFPWGYP